MDDVEHLLQLLHGLEDGSVDIEDPEDNECLKAALEAVLETVQECG